LAHASEAKSSWFCECPLKEETLQPPLRNLFSDTVDKALCVMSLFAVVTTRAIMLAWLLPINVCYAQDSQWDKPGVPGKAAEGMPGSIGIKIVNGQDADPCEWRWQVSFQGSCGGTLIAPSWIISAAHCARAGLTKVTVGDYNINSDQDNPGKVKTFNVKQWYNHPKYGDPVGNAHDFALVEIDGAVDTNECVGFAKLPTSSLTPGAKCWITGWGTLQSGGQQPSRLQEAVVTTVSNEECKKAYGNQITDDQLCAQGQSDSGKITDACQGDSGGPLVCEEDGTYTIHGATSWGRGCAQDKYPGVWSRVYEHLDFVDEHLRGGGSGCQDTDNGAKDSYGDGCKWYTEFDWDKTECGKHDTAEFKANNMCCHCGGGTGEQPTPAPTPDPNVCKNTDGGATDNDDDNCKWYTDNDEHGEHCGKHDDDDFDAVQMCCRCGGGTTGNEVPSRLFEYAGSAVPVAKAQMPMWQTLSIAAVAMTAGITALVAMTRRASIRDDEGTLAAGSDAELAASVVE